MLGVVFGTAPSYLIGRFRVPSPAQHPGWHVGMGKPRNIQRSTIPRLGHFAGLVYDFRGIRARFTLLYQKIVAITIAVGLCFWTLTLSYSSIECGIFSYQLTLLRSWAS